MGTTFKEKIKLIPGLTKDNPLTNPAKEWKDYVASNKELTETIKDLTLIVSKFFEDISPWVKAFLGAGTFLMGSWGVSIWWFIFNS